MKYDVYQGLFIWPQKKTLNLHLTYFVETGQCKKLRGKFINCYLCLQIHSLWS